MCVVFITVDAQHCNGIPADFREVLTGTRHWLITDNGAQDCTDASLSGLQVFTSDGTELSDELDPVFATGEKFYSLSVDSEVDMITVSATPTGEATPAYARNDADAGDESSIALDVGDTRVKVVVTAGDGMTTQTYTITVTREDPSVDATLSGLTVSTSDGTDLSDGLDPVFDPDVFGYTLSVVTGISSLIVHIVKPTESTVSYARNGTTITSLTDIPLDVGSTTIAVIVTSGDGRTTEAYTITVTRAAVSTDVALSSLSVSEGRLRHDFLTSRIEYTVFVSHDVQVLDVSATARDSNATLSYLRNDAAIENGAGIAIDVGKTIIKVIVTAEDMSTTQTYTITVTRVSDSDSTDIFGLTEPAPEFVSLYPNPVEDVLTIEWVSSTYQGTQVYLYNLSGDLLLYRSVSLGPGRHRISIDLSAENIKPGLYMLKLKTAKHTHYRRILKR